MKDLQEIKFIAEQIFTLTRELLRLVDMDEQARQKFIKDLKKTPMERYYIFLALNQMSSHKMRISKEITAICINLNTVMAVLQYAAVKEKTEQKGDFIREEFILTVNRKLYMGERKPNVWKN